MSVSIQKNKLALENINNARNNYNTVITTIKDKNNNSQTDEILGLINDNVQLLNEIEKKVKKINFNISNAEETTKGDKK